MFWWFALQTQYVSKVFTHEMLNGRRRALEYKN